MKKKLKLCILGTGFGNIAHIPSFHQNNKVEIISIFGRNIKKLKFLSKRYKIKNYYTNFDDLINNCNADFYSVALPPAQQFYYTKKILKYKKKPVLCEKPLTTSYNQAKELKELAIKNKCKSFVSYQMRFQPIRQKIKKLIHKKALGKILNINLSFDYSSRLYPEFKYNWWSDKQLGGGVLNAIGSHQLDLLVWYFGKIYKVFGKNSTYLKKRLDYKGKLKKVTADDISKFILFFKNFSASVSISSVSIGWKNSIMQIHGSKASLFLYGENRLKIIKKPKLNYQEKIKEIDISEKEKLFKLKWINKSIWKAAFLRQSKEIVDSLIGKKKYSGASFIHATYIRKIIDKIQQSSKKNKLITI